MITLLILLAIKHYIADFPLQNSYQYLNKGKIGHPGGLLHSGIHAIMTAAILAVFGISSYLIAFLAAAEGLIHYFTDLGKVKMNTYYGYGPTTHEEFWWLLGLDQLVHTLTYLWIVSICF